MVQVPETSADASCPRHCGLKNACLLWSFTLGVWKVQPTRGDQPCPRDGHVLVVDPTGGTGAGQFILFGGRNAGGFSSRATLLRSGV